MKKFSWKSEDVDRRHILAWEGESESERINRNLIAVPEIAEYPCRRSALAGHFATAIFKTERSI
jgi:hypothetical protein